MNEHPKSISETDDIKIRGNILVKRTATNLTEDLGESMDLRGLIPPKSTEFVVMNTIYGKPSRIQITSVTVPSLMVIINNGFTSNKWMRLRWR